MKQPQPKQLVGYPPPVIIKDLNFQRFGRLFVYGPCERRPGRQWWKCRCDCGNHVEVRSDSIGRNRVSCGCRQKETRELARQPLDLFGQEFGRLTAIMPLPPKRDRHIRWLCICRCGGWRITISSNLVAGVCTSCGCNQKENMVWWSKYRSAKKRTGNRLLGLFNPVVIEPHGRKVQLMEE